MLAATGVISSLTDWLDRVSGNWWFLAIILIIALLDSVIPIVPSETTVIIGGVAASSAGAASYNVVFVIIAGAIGAFIGDNLSYQIGRRASRLVERRAAKKESTAKKLKWADYYSLRLDLFRAAAPSSPSHRASPSNRRVGSWGGSASPPSSGLRMPPSWGMPSEANLKMITRRLFYWLLVRR